MTTPLGTADFFVLEAGDYLDRLEALVTRTGGPDADEFVRTARALRGSALMANQQPIARAAGALEAIARAHREGRRDWDAAAREGSAHAVEELRRLVRRTREWTEADTQRAARLAADLEQLAGGGLGERAWAPRASGATELNPGVRAFVAREGALIASALDRAAHALAADPLAREPLYTVLRRMQSLRGLAELSDLSPLPEILDGLELALGDLTRLYAPPPGAADTLHAAAQALTRVSRDVAEHARPTPDAAEAQRFTDFLLKAFAVEDDVVPVSALFVEGDPSPIARSATNPPFPQPGPLGALELVSHGEHLAQSADAVAGARSRTERDLRLYGLVAPLRALSTGAPAAIHTGLTAFTEAARAAIGSGRAAADAPAFAAALREAGAALHGAAEPGRMPALGAALEQLAVRLGGAPAAAGAVPGATAAVAPEADVVPIENLAYEGLPAMLEPQPPIVPIESLAPDTPETPAGEPADGAAELTGLEASFDTYARLLQQGGAAEPSIDALLSATTPTPAPTPAAAAEDLVVDIGAICYRGRGALDRAVVVRELLVSQLGSAPDLTALRPLLDELLDLVPLAREHG